MENEAHKQYLGDGVYIQFSQDYQLLLTTENGIATTNSIYLELDVLENMLLYLKQHNSRLNDNIIRKLKI